MLVKCIVIPRAYKIGDNCPTNIYIKLNIKFIHDSLKVIKMVVYNYIFACRSISPESEYFCNANGDWVFLDYDRTRESTLKRENV